MMTETMRNHRSLDFMGYPNYVIYVDGKVMNWTTGRILKPANNGTGYLFVNLRHNGFGKLITVHRIVSLAFIHNPDKNHT